MPQPPSACGAWYVCFLLVLVLSSPSLYLLCPIRFASYPLSSLLLSLLSLSSLSLLSIHNTHIYIYISPLSLSSLLLSRETPGAVGRSGARRM
jgi:hypothetical protein